MMDVTNIGGVVAAKSKVEDTQTMQLITVRRCAHE
jgi:hypothetical protein